LNNFCVSANTKKYGFLHIPVLTGKRVVLAEMRDGIGVGGFGVKGWKYLQLGIACDFLSSQKAARTERYTPKTTVTELVGYLK
jgi:hypothetical protein